DDGLGHGGGFRPHRHQLAVLPLHQRGGHSLVLAVFSEVEAPAGGGGSHGTLVGQHGGADLVGVGGTGFFDDVQEGVGTHVVHQAVAGTRLHAIALLVGFHKRAQTGSALL